ncbi:MAG: glycoside hydrolase family 9 protein [Spirochaetes bacterium]|jgi:endoglucanase|nr:glycoside hydrolase family 9 protein [Spirochaetota bacterium]
MIKKKYNKAFFQPFTVIFTVALLLLLMSCLQKSTEEPAGIRILVNQTGYYPEAVKYALAAKGADGIIFTVVSEEDNKPALKVRSTSTTHWDAAREDYSLIDFSELKKPGRYRIVSASGTESYPFEISDNLYQKPAIMLQRSFYYQRVGQDITKEFGGEWSWKAGHLQDSNSILHESTGKTGKIKSPGGWYDAGDYGKYMVNSGITVGTLLAFYELYPDFFGDNLNLPESGNSKSDLLDEIKYNMDWMLTMQDKDGGVFFKLSGLTWPGMILPANDTQDRYIIGKSTTSALNLAATAAMAGRIYKDYDSAYADRCLNAAQAAWKWAIDNPKVGNPDTSISGSGPYDDNSFDDEFVWAAAELYITTGSDEYIKTLKDNSYFVRIQGSQWWREVSNFAVFSLVFHNAKLPDNMAESAKESLISAADGLLLELYDSPGRVPMGLSQFAWGSHGTVGNKGIIIAYAHKLTGDKKYHDALIEIGDYLNGRNATGYTCATGLGSNPPMNPHHRPSEGGGFANPVPGLVVGGPNSRMEDGMDYPHQEPARCYIDKMKSYASNEPAINQNASVGFVFAYLAALEK